ncbi:MAG: toxin-antitoxin system HicB family antitoxin [Actinomycetota bacterium]|nr:toxin-antitoxin system HicB family antitoxin [Actinomycetota bacterium]
MKQLLLRVPDELHERLARRAVAEGMSVNALATGVLDVAVTDAGGTPKSTLRARATALGLSAPTALAASAPPMAEVHALLSGLTLDADELLDEQRDPG